MQRLIQSCLGSAWLAVAAGLLPELVCSEEQAAAAPPPAQRICYEVELSDPADPGIPVRSFPVELILTGQGFPEEYRLSLVTGVCPDQVCRPLIVTLFWDAIGNYTRLEYPENSPLTKSDHTEFSPRDCTRLNAILKDKRSILGTHPLSAFVWKSSPAEAEIDAVTAATPQTVQDAVVPGAAYTSWVLWRWVNGEITDKLQALTRLHCSADYVNHCLLSEDARLVQFALMHLLDAGRTSEDPMSNAAQQTQPPAALRPSPFNPSDPSLREGCFHILENGGRSSCRLALQYLTAQPPDADELNARLISLIGVNAGSSGLIFSYLQGLPGADPDLWDCLARHLTRISGYRDLDAALDLLAVRAAGSGIVQEQVAALLDSEDRFVVRRAKEFLNAGPVREDGRPGGPD